LREYVQWYRRPYAIRLNDAPAIVTLNLNPVRITEANSANGCPKADVSPGFARRVCDSSADLTISVSRVEEAAGPRGLESREKTKGLAGHFQKRSGRHSPTRLSDRDLFRRDSPDLSRIRKIEVTTDSLSETVLEHAGETLRVTVDRPRNESSKHITRNAHRERGRQVKYQILRLEREVNPASTQSNSAVPRSVEKLSVEKRLYVGKDLWFTGGMKAMAPIIHSDAVKFEAACIPSYIIALLDHDGACLSASSQLPRGADTGRPPTQNCHMTT
jgi:hypothetical protein